MINRQRKISFFSISLIVFSIVSNYVFAQFESHPEEDWFTIETKHFTVTYHTGAERTAQVIAKIAEEVYGPITDLYQFPLKDKVNFVVNDLSDVANGATDYYGNRIEIFATALDFELRGTHNWLRNVITHEFAHMVQIQASLKFAKNMPAIYLQWINYEKERRPDVLYGYPNVIVSYPISGVGVPAWFAEGTAQYQRQQMGYDYWDANRDMILRSYVLDNNMLTWNEMGQFSSITSLKAESIYNSGFALTQYIARVYGEDKLKKITNSLGDLANFSVDKAIKVHLGKDGNELYSEWKTFLQKDYNERISDVKNSLVDGEIIQLDGFANFYPKISPDGKKIAYLTNGTYDYGTTQLITYDLTSKSTEVIDAPVASNYSWSYDGKKLLYAKRNSPPTIGEAVLFDIYEYDYASKTERRLSKELRAFSPSYSPDGSKILYISGTDGTLNLFVSDNNLKNKKQVTFFKNGEQIYNPIFHSDGKTIIFDFSLTEARKIAKVDIETGNMEFIFDKEVIDYRTPAISKDGNKMYFSSNETGIFNIYTYDFRTKEVKQITNVLGGAFMPSIDENGNMAFTSYKSSGFKIAYLKNFMEKSKNEFGHYKAPEKLVSKYSSLDSTNISDNKFDWVKLRNFNDKDVNKLESKNYKSIFNQLSIFPVLRFDNYTKDNNILDAIKPGVYLYSDELMTRFSIFGGFSINRKAERDIFMQFTYNNGFPIGQKFLAKNLSFEPKFTLSGYNVTRKSNALLYAGVDTLSVGVAYDLLEFELAMDFKLINYNHDFRLTYALSKYASSIDGFYIPSSGLQTRASSQDYFKAQRVTIDYKYEKSFYNKNSDINPAGRKINLKYEFEASRINPEYQVDDQGNVSTVFTDNYLHKVEGIWTEGIYLFNGHSINLKMRAAGILGKPVDSFYDYYAGGLVGMRGYPYFSMGGGRLAHANLTYRFPLVSKIDTRISPLYLDKLYLSLFADIGDAWNGTTPQLNQFKKDIGAELRLQAFSSYVFPTSIFFSVAYGLDSFSKKYLGKDITYGKEMIYYFGMLFGFDI